MSKLKSFSLIEVTIASFIFMVVAIMATASFGMVRKSNERAQIFKDTGECREILQNYLENGVNNSSVGPRIMGIDSSLKFKDIKILENNADLNSLVPQDYQFIGLAMFEEDGSYSIIYKNDQKYLYKKIDNVASLPVAGDAVPAAEEFLKTGDLSCFGAPQSFGLAEPFKMWGLKNRVNQNSHLFTVELEEKIYNIKNPTEQDKNFSYLFSRSTNNSNQE